MAHSINVLVVDDEEIMRNLFSDILKDEGYNVTTMSNGKEAGDKAREQFFDIAFLDVHMPIIDGIKTLNLFREITPKTAVIMMDSMPEYMEEDPKKHGAVACIKKPFDIDEVKDIVHKIRGQ